MMPAGRDATAPVPIALVRRGDRGRGVAYNYRDGARSPGETMMNGRVKGLNARRVECSPIRPANPRH